MKRQLTLFALSVIAASPLAAQDPYYPAYGYAPEPTYDSDNTTRQFNFNPGDMMNMGNPMRSMFGSNRGYGDYPAARYTPPAYPPAYGYPAYPAYQQPYTDYGYEPQAPVYPDYDASYAQPPAQPTEFAPPPPQEVQTPNYNAMPPAAQHYQPRFSNPDQGTEFHFRPLNTGAQPAQQTVPVSQGRQSSVVAAPPAPVFRDTSPLTYPQESAYTEPAAPVYPDPQPLAPPTYPQESAFTEPAAPLNYAETGTTPPAPEMQVRDTLIEQDPSLKFRPLDKPGYSSELEQ